jgi:hypothetical protein
LQNTSLHVVLGSERHVVPCSLGIHHRYPKDFALMHGPVPVHVFRFLTTILTTHGRHFGLEACCLVIATESTMKAFISCATSVPFLSRMSATLLQTR